ncbi:MAG TPA: DUF2007 domain-containing protein [Sphingomicrobium sp.]|nr:DUF2007 domain-containing protein [Sphingomicrobium sp.]
MALVELAKFHTRIEADLARLYLESGGIDVVLFDTEMHGTIGVGHLMPVRLMVLDEDEDEARRMLAEDRT